MREGPLPEAEGGSLSLNVLLAHTSNNLDEGINKREMFTRRREKTCDTLISDPLEPATTITLKLLNSVRDLLAEPTVLSLG